MRTIPALLLSAVLPCTSLLAQEDQAQPTPPSELARFARLIGNWEGSGSATMEPGAPKMNWTATTCTRKVLGGFFLQEDTVINAGEEAPAPIIFRSFYGFDRENKKYMACGISNMGQASASEIYWADENTMVTIETNIENDQVVVDRWVTHLGTDHYSFKGLRAIGAGEFFVHVEGEMKRVANAVEGQPLEAAAGFAPPGAEMEKLNRMAGRYSIKGRIQMNPDAAPMEISASEVVAPIFGGSVLQARVKGDPIPGMGAYEGWAAFAWNPTKNCYTSIYVNNMGEIGSAGVRWVGNDLVSTLAQLRQGQPAVGRSIVTVGSDGAVRKAVMHSLVANHAAMKDFEATYTREKN